MDREKILNIFALNSVEDGIVFMFLVYAIDRFIEGNGIDALRKIAAEFEMEKEWASFEVAFLKK